jgi:hypothetical protein
MRCQESGVGGGIDSDCKKRALRFRRDLRAAERKQATSIKSMYRMFLQPSDTISDAVLNNFMRVDQADLGLFA